MGLAWAYKLIILCVVYVCACTPTSSSGESTNHTRSADDQHLSTADLDPAGQAAVLLNVSVNASSRAIGAAWRSYALHCHPDKCKTEKVCSAAKPRFYFVQF
jgi:hypothetical protein